MPHLDAISNDALPPRCRVIPTDIMRQRALARLYERRSAVDQLIDSLERYQSAYRSKCVEITSVTSS